MADTPPQRGPRAAASLTQRQIAHLRGLRAFLVDLDGVVYTGNTPVPGAREFFQFLTATGRRFQCITNNSTLTADQFAAKLRAMHVDVRPDQVLTSSHATAIALGDGLPRGARVMAIGEEGLVRALVDGGFKLVTERPDALVCGLDRQLTYQRLTAACLAVRTGIPFIATNPDLSLPTEHGFLPGNGAAVAYIQTATGVAPTVIGKPEATLLQVAMELLGVAPEETAIVGDGVLTDMLAGQRAGVTKILVFTGVSTQADVAGAPAPPDFTFADLPALQQILAGG
jgi:4-nitrophenyl phosphatase